MAKAAEEVEGGEVVVTTEVLATLQHLESNVEGRATNLHLPQMNTGKKPPVNGLAL